jgi:hypothetical protein
LITLGCTQEAPLFRGVATAINTKVSFVNLRETAADRPMPRTRDQRSRRS